MRGWQKRPPRPWGEVSPRKSRAALSAITTTGGNTRWLVVPASVSARTLPTLSEGGVAVAPLKTAQGAEFKQQMERPLIAGGVRLPAETRDLILQAEAQFVR